MNNMQKTIEKWMKTPLMQQLNVTIQQIPHVVYCFEKQVQFNSEYELHPQFKRIIVPILARILQTTSILGGNANYDVPEKIKVKSLGIKFEPIEAVENILDTEASLAEELATKLKDILKSIKDDGIIFFRGIGHDSDNAILLFYEIS